MDSLTREVAARFDQERELRCEARALAWHAALLAAFAALCAGLLPAWAFMIVGLSAYIRNFNAIHQSAHTRPERGSPLRPFRRVAMIVHGPLQLGRDELATDHRRHHAHPGDPRLDPHIAVHSARWSSALAQALLQPELAAIQHIRRAGALRPGMRRALAYNLAVTAALLALGGANFLWWIAVTRLGSTACWFVFDFMLHSPRLWGRHGALPLPRPLRWTWIALFGRDNLHATLHHPLHHRFATVRDRDLPALARLLAARAPSAAV